MTEPTLASVFGAGATQSSTQITILKADLAVVGLTASPTNTPESLLAAMFAQAQLGLGELTYDTNLDQSITITDGTDSLVTRNNTTYRQKTKTVNFFKPDTLGNFDPDDY